MSPKTRQQKMAPGDKTKKSEKSDKPDKPQPTDTPKQPVQTTISLGDSIRKTLSSVRDKVINPATEVDSDQVSENKDSASGTVSTKNNLLPMFDDTETRVKNLIMNVICTIPLTVMMILMPVWTLPLPKIIRSPSCLAI